MAKFTERCPHCGNVVEGVVMRSNKNKNVREVAKKGIPGAVKIGGSVLVAASVGGMGGKALGKATNGGLDYLHEKHRSKIDRGIDAGFDLIEDTFFNMNYEFVCPQCGHTWVQDREKCEVNAMFNKLMDEYEGDYGEYNEDDFECTNIYERDLMGYDEDEEDGDGEYIRIEEYKWRKILVALRHYCSYMVFDSQPEGEFDCEQLVDSVNDDTGMSITVQQIQANTDLEVLDKLFDALTSPIDTDFDWFDLVANLPYYNSSDNYRMEVYDSVYIEGRVEAFGNTLIGVNVAGSIEVDDEIAIFTTDGERIDTKVIWIEDNEEKVDFAECGDTIGLGVNIDLREISGTIDYVCKCEDLEDEEYEEEYEEYEDEDEEELTSEEQKYIKELRDMLSDGEILPRGRRLLDKIRTQLGISDERATELEESLKSTSLTPEEQEYLDEYKEIVAEGEISARDQKFLNKLKKANGISDERAEELEAMA